MQALQKQQIACAIYYPVPLHQQSVFKQDCAGVSLPITESIAADCFSLPICPSLSDNTIKDIVAVIASVLKK
jgi:dTDP-4-amino-4,6-dideoxygalactose transaminase